MIGRQIINHQSDIGNLEGRASMAEATDRPHDTEPAASNVASAEERVSTQPQPLAAPRGELGTLAPTATETYRPLSLLALAGFGIAVVYALVVLIGAAVALFSHIPWLMPVWTFLLPLAALVLCWAARSQIRDSEGTLSGLAFTTWGLRLAILVGLTYAAYYGATFFAVRGQAVDWADSFFEQLKQGHEDQAFVFGLGIPGKEVDNAELRNTLELRYNTPSAAPGSVGELTRFRQAQYVRFIEMAGDKANIALKGVSEWGYTKEGYRVVLKYHIATAMVDFDLNLETFGRDSKPGEPKGRQWQVVLPRSDTAIPPESLKMTPHGKEVMQKKIRMAERFASDWIEKINLQEWTKAAVDTLPPSERSARFVDKLEEAKKNLASGKLFRIDENRFWAGKLQKDEIKKRIRNTFQPGSPPFMLSLSQVMPLVREQDDRITALFDVYLRYSEASAGKPQFIVQGQLVVTTQEPDAANRSSAWQIEALDIDSGRTPPEPSRPPKR
jgi:hypothetical protein